MFVTASQRGDSGNVEITEDTDVPSTLVLMAGLPGVGKTLFANALQCEVGLRVINKDAYIKDYLHYMQKLHIQGILHSIKSWNFLNKKPWRKRRSLDEYLAARFAYRRVFNEVDAALSNRESVILDSAALHKFILKQAEEIVRTVPGAQLRVIYCTVNHALRVERMRLRAEEMLRQGLDPHPTPWIDPDVDVDEAELFKHLPTERLKLDMSRDVKENLEDAREYIWKRGLVEEQQTAPLPVQQHTSPQKHKSWSASKILLVL